MHCAVLDCSTNDPNDRRKGEIFLPFPEDQNMCKVWKYACGRGEDFQTDKARICERHFDKTDYERHIVRFDYTDKGIKKYRQIQLKSYAIPTLNLPKLSGNVSHNILIPKKEEYGTNVYARNKAELVDKTTVQTGCAKSYEKKCAVANCNMRGRVIYDFPHYKHQKNLFTRWLSLCENEVIKNLQPDDINKSFGICSEHFEKEVVILPELLPTVDLPGPKAEKEDEPYEANQLCRLCFSVGSVDLFSCKYYKMALKDIVKTFVPIEIKYGDPSTLICENCKSEVIHFYNFLLKSLRVNEYFEAINKEVNNEDGTKGNMIELIRIEDAVIEEITVIDENKESLEVIAEEDIATDVKNEVVEVEDNWYDEKGEYEPSLLRTCLTSDPKIPAKDVISEAVNVKSEEKYSNYVPEYALKHFHSYVKTSQKGAKKTRKKKIYQPSEEATLTETVITEDATVLEAEEAKGDTIICIHCNEVIEDLDKFNEHCRIENHDPVFRCPDCNRMFKTQSELDTHSDSHRKWNSNLCDRCGKQFTKREGLYLHLNTVHYRHTMKHECNVCNKKFATNYRLKLHTRIHTNDKPFCCEQCGAVFTLLPHLRNHQTIHSDFRPHVCLICNKGFLRRHKLALHLTKHTGERKFSCDKCGISYKRQVNLTRHNKKHHPNPNEIVEERPRQCSLCDFVCNFPVQLRVHTLKEHKSYTCTICNMTFKNYQPYYNHKFKHFPNKKKFLCKYCNKRFINATLLNVHMVVHTGKKNYECQLCKKRFSQRPHLQSHLLIHTGEKPHKCLVCMKSFAHLSTLVVHQRIHTGETPYVCQFCNKGFGHLTNYKKHAFSQHGVIMPKQRDYSQVKKVNEDENEDSNAAEIIMDPLIEFVNEEIIDEDSLNPSGAVALTEICI